MLYSRFIVDISLVSATAATLFSLFSSLKYDMIEFIEVK